MPPGIGKGLGNQVMQQFVQATLATEIIYSFIIIAISLIVYFSTKEIYSLTKHKGIKYFRMSFLFFAIAFFFRSFIKSLTMMLEVPKIIDFNPLLGGIFLFLFIYASVMAIFYLIFSVVGKKWKINKIFLFHFVAVLIALIVLLAGNSWVIIFIHILLFLFVTGATYFSSKFKKNKKSHFSGVYLLLFVFWIFNILDLLVPSVFIGFQLLIYLASISIFLSILYKVLKKVG